MEHLLAPPSSQPIKVPYVGIQEFDAGELLVPDNVLVFFKSYLDRNRWVRDRATANVIFTNRSPEDIARCFQTWLYFGCIISVFRLLNVIIRTRDLLSGSYGLNEVLVDTTRLHGYIAEAAKREGFAQGPTVQDFASQKYMRGQNIKEMLNMTFLYLPMYSKESDSMPEPFKSRMRLIELSIMAMGETLCNVLVAIYGDDFRDMPNWGCSPILEDRLRQNGWCISDSPFFPESLQRSAISAAYYFGGYACPRPPKDHSTCSPAICNGYLQVINAGTYVQKHVSPSCSCTDIKVPTAARDIVKRQTIPVIHWNGTRLNVRESTPHTIYVALSHV